MSSDITLPREAKTCKECKRFSTECRPSGIEKNDTTCDNFEPLTTEYWFNDTPLPNKIADTLMKDFILKTIIDTEEILYYDPRDGLYHYGGEQLIKREIQSGKYGNGKSLSTISRHWQNEVINIIQAKTYIQRGDINNRHQLIHLKNGIYDLNTDTVIEFTPKAISTINIPIVCDPNAYCPKIKKFLSEILNEDDIPVIEELFGYCLYRGLPIHKAIMFLGEGANGKSTLLNLFKAFLGDSNVSAVSLQNLDNNRFATSGLNGKLANIVPDIPNKALVHTVIFKSLTGGDLIRGERKFKEPFDFISYTKLIFSCNKLPETHDDTYAFYRRWILINFPNIFEGKNADKQLINNLTTEVELSGLFNLAIKGLKRLLENGEFTNSESTEEIRERYIWLSDSLKAFVDKCVEYDSDGWISKDDFYNRYAQFCREHKLNAKAKNVVGRELMRLMTTETTRHKVEGTQKYGWSGIKFKEEVEEDTLQNDSLAHNIENFESDIYEKEEAKE